MMHEPVNLLLIPCKFWEKGQIPFFPGKLNSKRREEIMTILTMCDPPITFWAVSCRLAELSDGVSNYLWLT